MRNVSAKLRGLNTGSLQVASDYIAKVRSETLSDKVQHATTQGRAKEDAMHADLLLRTASVTAVFAMDVNISLVFHRFA